MNLLSILDLQQPSVFAVRLAAIVRQVRIAFFAINYKKTSFFTISKRITIIIDQRTVKMKIHTSTSRVRTSFDPELELPKLHQWFAENPHPSRLTLQMYVKELNSLASRQSRKSLEVHNLCYWFKNARAAYKRAELRLKKTNSNSNHNQQRNFEQLNSITTTTTNLLEQSLMRQNNQQLILDNNNDNNNNTSISPLIMPLNQHNGLVTTKQQTNDPNIGNLISSQLTLTRNASSNSIASSKQSLQQQLSSSSTSLAIKKNCYGKNHLSLTMTSSSPSSSPSSPPISISLGDESKEGSFSDCELPDVKMFGQQASKINNNTIFNTNSTSNNVVGVVNSMAGGVVVGSTGLGAAATTTAAGNLEQLLINGKAGCLFNRSFNSCSANNRANLMEAVTNQLQLADNNCNNNINSNNEQIHSRADSTSPSSTVSISTATGVTVGGSSGQATNNQASLSNIELANAVNCLLNTATNFTAAAAAAAAAAASTTLTSASLQGPAATSLAFNLAATLLQSNLVNPSGQIVDPAAASLLAAAMLSGRNNVNVNAAAAAAALTHPAAAAAATLVDPHNQPIRQLFTAFNPTNYQLLNLGMLDNKVLDSNILHNMVFPTSACAPELTSLRGFSNQSSSRQHNNANYNHNHHYHHHHHQRSKLNGSRANGI